MQLPALLCLSARLPQPLVVMDFLFALFLGLANLGDVIVSQAYFGLVLSLLTHKWLRSKFSCTSAMEIEILRAAEVILVVMGMGHSKPVAILKHQPDVRGQPGSEELFFSQHSFMCNGLSLNVSVPEPAAPSCHRGCEQPFWQGLQEPAQAAVF